MAIFLVSSCWSRVKNLPILFRVVSLVPHWPWGNRMIAPLPVKYGWSIRVNWSTMELVWWDWESDSENTEISLFAWHALYKIMSIIPVMKDRMSQGMVKIKPFLWNKVWFSGINSLVQKIIGRCLECQTSVVDNSRVPLEMSPLSDRPWLELSWTCQMASISSS